jgi:hypothetical protein
MSFEFSQSPQAIWLYQYDADGVYIGSVFMTIPAGTGLPVNTTHIPCEPDKGQTGIFKNGVWEYVEDIRGTRYWNIHGTGFVISALSESLPEWAVTIEPPVADAGYVLLFTDGQWTQIEDKTGQLYYESNGTKHVVSDAWFTLPEGCTFVAPPEDKRRSSPAGTALSGFMSKTCAARLSGIPKPASRPSPISVPFLTATPSKCRVSLMNGMAQPG